MWANLMRWVRIRGLTEGKMQKGRVEGLPNDVRDAAQRPQDYGFAGNPVDGQGLKLEIGGHTVIIRMDRVAERPHLAAYEVAVWHKEGHMVRLKAGRIVQVDCDQFVVNASAGVVFNTPAVTASGAMAAATSLKVGGKEVLGHNHGSVQRGSDSTANF
ncbi:phage baseplate assembly protein domain-containing protein [Rhodoferax fermentans]|uniref:Bacteriophage Mu Gp45 N-terminal domain-containing protein n=1 Tax=Rhodoferax fermentans TaxID=28066 RepID=A0A1T1APB6_RHOFE|nr:phage baseplate assembly protein [Rhodoferax fermentans]MBK1683386.1 hypothetical protein [Rhodoferax fermentans]OOV05865.1 hypothetical protein RF819_03290 [Rhodoferax fermentans]